MQTITEYTFFTPGSRAISRLSRRRCTHGFLEHLTFLKHGRGQTMCSNCRIPSKRMMSTPYATIESYNGEKSTSRIHWWAWAFINQKATFMVVDLASAVGISSVAVIVFGSYEFWFESSFESRFECCCDCSCACCCEAGCELYWEIQMVQVYKFRCPDTEPSWIMLYFRLH